ncbi:MAG: hypothetical protein EBS56_02445 [Planctomycetia bacterium]|nr:hypothetical protein [Planctomycetia bacterium]
MQIITFTVAGQSYAIPSRAVIEVLPLVPARPLPLLPDYIPGVFTYRGRLVPLVDLGRRFGTPPAAGAGRRRLSTRVIVVEFPAPPPRGDALAESDPSRAVRLGLIADDVVSIQVAAGAEPAAGPTTHAPFLGRLLRLPEGTTQVVLVEGLLPPDLLDGLAAAVAGAAGP